MKRADISIPFLLGLILTLMVAVPATIWVFNQFTRLSTQAENDFNSLSSLTDEVGKSEVSTILSQPFVMDKDTAIVFFKKDETSFDFTTKVTTYTENSAVELNYDYKIIRPAGDEGNLFCLCRTLENVKSGGKATTTYNCAKSTCSAKNFNIVFDVTGCEKITSNCVDKNGDGILPYVFSVVPVYQKRLALYVKKTDENTLTITDKIK